MNTVPDISVILTTFNREASLARTLDSMSRLQPAGTAEFVVVDNNSSDGTRAVVRSFEGRLPLRYLFEERPGKSAATNRALREATLGDVVVFTDDDVIPRQDWLVQIHRTCERWPDFAVFGGRIDVVWPYPDVPRWALDGAIQGWAFSRHDLGDRDAPYTEPYLPVGPNYWVRREVLSGAGFDVSVGPRPAKKAMGCETAFLRALGRAGHRMMYAPDAAVDHCLQPALVTPAGIRRKAYAYGRGGPRVWGLCRPELLQQHPWMWRVLRVAALGRACGRYAWAQLSPTASRRLLRSLEPLSDIAYNLESLRAVRGEDRAAEGRASLV